MMDASIRLEESLAVLGLMSGASMKDIRSAFRQLARTCHPDIAGPQAAPQFEKITAAYMFLKSKESDVATLRQGGGAWKQGRARNTQQQPERETAQNTKNSERIRQLRLEKILVDTELKMAHLLERAQEVDGKTDLARSQQRLLSTHPAVRRLAAGFLIKYFDQPGVAESFVNMADRYPEDEDSLTLIFEGIFYQPVLLTFAEAVSAKACQVSEKAALSYLRWIGNVPCRESLLQRFLSHPSVEVIVKALSRWPYNGEAPDEISVLRLLRSDDERILVPLLQILKRKGCPEWAVGRVCLLARSHNAPAVRVWAGSIVRKKNLV